MKKLLLIAFCVFMSMSTQARVLFNAKAGLGISYLRYDGKNLGTSFSYKASFGADVNLGKNFRLFPSVEFTNNKGTLSAIDVDLYDSYNLQVPVLVGYKISKSKYNINFKVGPYFSYQLSDHTYTDGFYVDEYDYGIDAGIEMERGRFIIGLDYQLGLGSPAEMYTNDTSLNTTALYLTAGIRF